jgi:hypothetical protein
MLGVMFEHGNLAVGTERGLVVIVAGTDTIRLDRDAAHWLLYAGLPAALAQLPPVEDEP